MYPSIDHNPEKALERKTGLSGFGPDSGFGRVSTKFKICYSTKQIKQN